MAYSVVYRRFTILEISFISYTLFKKRMVRNNTRINNQNAGSILIWWMNIQFFDINILVFIKIKKRNRWTVDTGNLFQLDYFLKDISGNSNPKQNKRFRYKLVCYPEIWIAGISGLELINKINIFLKVRQSPEFNVDKFRWASKRVLSQIFADLLLSGYIPKRLNRVEKFIFRATFSGICLELTLELSKIFIITKNNPVSFFIFC
ncbi:MAG: hypothetical protein WCO26_10715 [Deltaproteobacteria bacterium]